MIVLYNPKATKPRNRRFPLSILAIAAVLEGREDVAIVDGNLDPHPTETMSLTDILANSSNIGTIMIGQKVGKDKIDSYMRKFGFGTKTSLNFPNESAGIMLPLQNWSEEVM